MFFRANMKDSESKPYKRHKSKHSHEKSASKRGPSRSSRHGPSHLLGAVVSPSGEHFPDIYVLVLISSAVASSSLSLLKRKDGDKKHKDDDKKHKDDDKRSKDDKKKKDDEKKNRDDKNKKDDDKKKKDEKKREDDKKKDDKRKDDDKKKAHRTKENSTSGKRNH